MSDSIHDAMRESARLFELLVWPAISSRLGGGRCITTEDRNSYEEVARLLDRCAGIDALQLVQGKLRGLACRVQPVSSPYNTFTIRNTLPQGGETECTKRQTALRGGGFLYPVITIQAYINLAKTHLLRAGITATADLYEYVVEYGMGMKLPDTLRVYQQTCGQDGNGFLVVPWYRYGQERELVCVPR